MARDGGRGERKVAGIRRASETSMRDWLEVPVFLRCATKTGRTKKGKALRKPEGRKRGKHYENRKDVKAITIW